MARASEQDIQTEERIASEETHYPIHRIVMDHHDAIAALRAEVEALKARNTIKEAVDYLDKQPKPPAAKCPECGGCEFQVRAAGCDSEFGPPPYNDRRWYEKRDFHTRDCPLCTPPAAKPATDAAVVESAEDAVRTIWRTSCKDQAAEAIRARDAAIAADAVRRERQRLSREFRPTHEYDGAYIRAIINPPESKA